MEWLIEKGRAQKCTVKTTQVRKWTPSSFFTHILSCFSEWQLHFPLPQIKFLLGARTQASDSSWLTYSQICHSRSKGFPGLSFKNPRQGLWLAQLWSQAHMLIHTPWPSEWSAMIGSPHRKHLHGWVSGMVSSEKLVPPQKRDTCPADITVDVLCKIIQVKFVPSTPHLSLFLSPSASVLMMPHAAHHHPKNRKGRTLLSHPLQSSSVPFLKNTLSPENVTYEIFILKWQELIRGTKIPGFY